MNIIEKVRLIADGEFEVCAKLSVDEITQICRDLRGAKYALDIAEQKLASMENQEPEPYDAGFLNDFGGGNVSWWHDYIRAELDRAHDHYVEQFNVPAETETTKLSGKVNAKLKRELLDKPATPEDGCLCQGCANRYVADLLVPDDVWEQIKPDGKPVASGLLCPNCIMTRVVERGIWSAGRVEDIDKSAVVVPDDVKTALSRLDKTHYKQWDKESPTCGGYICGDVNTMHIVKIVEFVRELASSPSHSQQSAKSGYAGVTVWVGDKTITQIVSRLEIETSSADELLRRFENARHLLSQSDRCPSHESEQGGAQ